MGILEIVLIISTVTSTYMVTPHDSRPKEDIIYQDYNGGRAKVRKPRILNIKGKSIPEIILNLAR